MLRIYKEYNLNKILQRSKRHKFMIISMQKDHCNYNALHYAFSILRYRANILLKMLYPSGILNYFDSKYNFIYTMYVPERDLYIDFNVETEHRGPYDVERPFNPLNEEDVQFVNEAHEYYKNGYFKYWVAVAKAFTWARYDYRKFRLMKMLHKNYKIYWNIQEIETMLSSELVELSYAYVSQFTNAINLQNILYKNVDELLLSTGKSNGITNMIEIE